MATLEDIAGGTEGNLLIVGHAGVNRVMIARALGMPLKNLFDIPQHYGCLNILAAGASGLSAVAINLIPPRP
jgi:probable phosphoglycerate mutase